MNKIQSLLSRRPMWLGTQMHKEIKFHGEWHDNRCEKIIWVLGKKITVFQFLYDISPVINVIWKSAIISVTVYKR